MRLQDDHVGAAKSATWRRLIEGSVHLYTLYSEAPPSKDLQQQPQQQQQLSLTAPPADGQGSGNGGSAGAAGPLTGGGALLPSRPQEKQAHAQPPLAVAPGVPTRVPALLVPLRCSSPCVAASVEEGTARGQQGACSLARSGRRMPLLAPSHHFEFSKGNSKEERKE